MKKELPKIAIKYSEEVRKYLKSKGLKVGGKKKLHLVEKERYSDQIICICNKNWFGGNWKNVDFSYIHSDENSFKKEGFEIIDFGKLKSYFEDEVKEEFKLGQWYELKEDGFLFLPTVKTAEEYYQGAGFDKYECWGYCFEESNPIGYKPAHMTKVKELLIKEAERRGVCLKCSVNGWNVLKLEYEIISGRFFVNGILLFTFSNGKWEDILSPKS